MSSAAVVPSSSTSSRYTTIRSKKYEIGEWDTPLLRLLRLDSLVGDNVIDLPHSLLRLAEKNRYGERTHTLLGIDRFENMVFLYDDTFIARLLEVQRQMLNAYTEFTSPAAVAEREARKDALEQQLDAEDDSERYDALERELQEIERLEGYVQDFAGCIKKRQRQIEELNVQPLLPSPQQINHGDVLQFNDERCWCSVVAFKSRKGTFKRLTNAFSAFVETKIQRRIDELQEGKAYNDATETEVTRPLTIQWPTINLQKREWPDADTATNEYEIIMFPTMDENGWLIPPLFADAPADFFREHDSDFVERFIYPQLSPFTEAIARPAAAESDEAAVNGEGAVTSVVERAAAAARARSLNPSYWCASEHADDNECVDAADFPHEYFGRWQEHGNNAAEASRRYTARATADMPFSPVQWRHFRDSVKDLFDQQSTHFYWTQWMNENA